MLLTASRFFMHRELPVHLYYTCQNSTSRHSHEFAEIAIILAGECRYETAFGSEMLSAGDVVFIPQGEEHLYSDNKDVELVNILFRFDELTFPYHDISGTPEFNILFRLRAEYCRKMKYYPRIFLKKDQLETVKNILLPAWKNQERKLPGATLGVYGAFLQMIPILLDAWRSGNSPLYRSEHALIPEVISKMHSRFREKLMIPDLAREAGMSESTFNRHFKAATGDTPVDYLLKLRLQHAAEKIALGTPVSEAAFAAGFSDSNYFSRAFKKKYGVSPLKFCKMKK